jgi:rod shape-determining protein MreB and related proteins
MFGLFIPIIYIMISPDLLTVKNIQTGMVIAELPELAISKPPNRKILAVGANARSTAALQAAEIINPFGHPRSLVSDFVVAEQLLKHQIRRVLANKLFSASPIVVMHPLGSPLGGFTQVELRAFSEMALGAGAAKVYLKEGRPLTDQEVLQIQKDKASVK